MNLFLFTKVCITSFHFPESGSWLCKYDCFLSSSSNWNPLIFRVSFFFLLLTTSLQWASQSMLPTTDLLFIPANWTSLDYPNLESSPMLPSDFDLLLSSSILPFDIISGTSSWFDSLFPSASFDAITSMCLPSNPSLMYICSTNSTRFSTLYYFVTACQLQWDLNTYVFDGYTDMFPKVCADPIRYCYNKIISFNKRYLQEHFYKKHNRYIESKLNLRINQDIA